MLYSLIDRLIELCIEKNLINTLDEIYVRNRILASFQEENYVESPKISTDFFQTLEQLTYIAVEKGIIEDLLYEKDIFTSNLMNIFLDKPSIINKRFYELYNASPKAATDYFYNLSKDTNYIKMNRIAKNIKFKSPSRYGAIDITINLSKPEKDPKQIALEKNMNKGTYPTCLLCKENEGYNGTITHPDRGNHRTISMEINNGSWKLQYSPYVYYNEHCIVLSDEHAPMKISKNTFKNLLSFVEKLPHYFLGSNADLPIVGGSILAHEHYQGGRYEFPINRAEQLFTFSMMNYPGVTATALKWPLSTIRLTGKDIEELVNCSDYIFKAWENYSDEKLQLLSHSGNTPHNTITPIARKCDECYEIDLVLRNNRTTEEFPLGIFHPHNDVHHIKKENIGLIEVMGLAVLPGRLKTELEAVKAFVGGTSPIETVPEYHRPWAFSIKAAYSVNDDLNRFIELEVGKKFTRVLEDAGVYKQDEEGIAGLKRFVKTL